MCLCGFLIALCLLVINLVAQAIVFSGLVVISFGLSLIGVLIVNLIRNDPGINTTAWAMAALVILSYMTEGLFFGFSFSTVKIWLDKQKKKSKCVLIKLPHLLYFLLFCGAVSQFYFQHKLIMTTAVGAGKNTSTKNKTGLTMTATPGQKTDFSVIFLFAMSYIVYTTASSSDWSKFRSQSEGVRANFACRTLYECICCILLEILNTVLNLLTLTILAIPIIVEVFEFPPICIMLSGLGIAVLAAMLKFDKACPQFGTTKFDIMRHKLYAKTFLLTHIWYPLLVLWFMKDQNLTLFKDQMSDRQDFAIWASLVSAALLKTVRNLNVRCKAPRSLAIWDNRVGEEPVSGDDKDNLKTKIKTKPTRTRPTSSTWSESEAESSVHSIKQDTIKPEWNEWMSDEMANNNNIAFLLKHRKNLPAPVHQLTTSPSAPRYEEIDEIPTSKQWKTTVVKARPLPVAEAKDPLPMPWSGPDSSMV